MTKADIMRMAREAGLQPYYDEQETAIEAFANLVAAHKAEVITAEAYRCGYEAGVLAEREACAKLCLETEPFYGVMFADVIRARGTT